MKHKLKEIALPRPGPASSHMAVFSPAFTNFSLAGWHPLCPAGRVVGKQFLIQVLQDWCPSQAERDLMFKAVFFGCLSV